MPPATPASGMTPPFIEGSASAIWIAQRFDALEHGPALIDLPTRPAVVGDQRKDTRRFSELPLAQRLQTVAMADFLEAATEAVEQAKRAADIIPSPLSFRILGHVLSAEKRWDEAAAAYRNALSLDPVDATAWRAFGLSRYALGMFGDAVCGLSRAVRCAPDAGEFRRNLARALWAQRHLEKAKAQYAIVLALDPSFGEAWRNRGLVVFAAGNAQAALNAFERACRLDSTLRDIDYLLGCALNRLGRLEDAASRFESALDSAFPPPAHAAIALRIVAGALERPLHAARTALCAAAAFGDVPRRADDGDIHHLTPADFPTLFAGLGKTVEQLPALTPPGPPPPRFGDDAHASVLNDIAFATRGLFLARNTALSVWRGRGAFSAYIITTDHYLATKVYERPNQTATSRSCYFPPDDDYVMPDWLVDLRKTRQLDIDEPCLYLGGTANYGHFLIDILSKLWVSREFEVDERLPVALFPHVGVFRDMVDFFFPNRRIIDLAALCGEDDALMRFRHATVASNPPNHFTRAAIRTAVDRQLGPPSHPPWRKVYLSRRNYHPHRHRVANETEIAAWLVSLGFEVIEPETLSFVETIELFRTTRLFVSPCGAQNVNICFSQPGTVYVELGASYHRGERSWFINDCLGYYGDVLYVRHYGETLFVAPGGHDNNWLSYHPINELQAFFNDLAIAID